MPVYESGKIIYNLLGEYCKLSSVNSNDLLKSQANEHQYFLNPQRFSQWTHCQISPETDLIFTFDDTVGRCRQVSFISFFSPAHPWYLAAKIMVHWERCTEAVTIYNFRSSNCGSPTSAGCYFIPLVHITMNKHCTIIVCYCFCPCSLHNFITFLIFIAKFNSGRGPPQSMSRAPTCAWTRMPNLPLFAPYTPPPPTTHHHPQSWWETIMWEHLRHWGWMETGEHHLISFSATSISSALCSGALL